MGTLFRRGTLWRISWVLMLTIKENREAVLNMKIYLNRQIG